MGNDWLLVFFTAFAVTGAGMTVAASAGEERNAPAGVQLFATAFALVCLAVGGLLSVLHLGRPELIFGALSNPGTGIFREFVTFALTAAALVSYLILLLRSAEAGTTLWVARIAAVSAVLLAASVGSAFVMPWRPAWNTWTLVLPYVGWCAVAAACARRLLLATAKEDDPSGTLLTLGSIALLAVFTAVYLAATVMTGGTEAAVGRLIAGDLCAPFWGTVLVGMILPAGLVLIPGMKVIGSAAAIAAVFAGSALFQWIVQLLGTPSWHFFG